MTVFSIFQTGVATFILSCTHEAKWTPFQTHYFPENLVDLGIEPGRLDLYPGTLPTRPQRRSKGKYIIILKRIPVNYSETTSASTYTLPRLSNQDLLRCRPLNTQEHIHHVTIATSRSVQGQSTLPTEEGLQLHH
jgi:hypothetical protein